MSTPTFVAKRFLQGVAGDLVNADYIVRLFIADGKLFAVMASGGNIELEPPTTAPLTLTEPSALPVKMVSL